MKEKDPLEEFIRSNRESFDDLKAPARVWKRIGKRSAPVHHLWKWSAIAAGALLLLAVGYIMGNSGNRMYHSQEWAEYQEAEQYYQTRVNQKLSEVKTLPVSDQVLTDLQMLDEVYEELRKQLLEDPNASPQVLLAAMVKHQQQKLDVLEKIINRLNKYNHQKNDKHEI